MARRFGIGRTFFEFGFVVPGPRGAIAGERSGKDVVGVCYVTDALNHARLFMEVEFSSKFLRRGKVDPDFRVRRHVLLQSACGERPAEFDRIRIPGTLKNPVGAIPEQDMRPRLFGRIGHGFNSGGADLVNGFLQIGLRDGGRPSPEVQRIGRRGSPFIEFEHLAHSDVGSSEGRQWRPWRVRFHRDPSH